MFFLFIFFGIFIGKIFSLSCAVIIINNGFREIFRFLDYKKIMSSKQAHLKGVLIFYGFFGEKKTA